MNSKEYWQGIRDIEARRVKAERLVALKAEREQAARRERAARENERFATQYGLDPARIYQPQPKVLMPAGFSLRAGPRADEIARRARRVDDILRGLH